MCNCIGCFVRAMFSVEQQWKFSAFFLSSAVACLCAILLTLTATALLSLRGGSTVLRCLCCASCRSNIIHMPGKMKTITINDSEICKASARAHALTHARSRPNGIDTVKVCASIVCALCTARLRGPRRAEHFVRVYTSN